MLYILTPLFCVALLCSAVFSFLNSYGKVSAEAAVAVAQSTFAGTCVGKYSKSGVNFTGISYATVAANSSTAGTLNFTGGTGSMSASSSKANNALAYVGYISFDATISVPAYTTYDITYEFNLKLVATKSGTTGASCTTELVYFGNSENGGSNITALTFAATNVSCYSSGRMGYLSGAVNYNSSKTISVPITYTNNTNAPINCTAYFGFNSGNNYCGGDGKMTVNSTLTLTKETVVPTELSAAVDVTATPYNALNQNFTFTYDTLRSSVTKAEYTDTAGTTTTTYDKAAYTGVMPLDSSGIMTAKEAGTYTVYFDINDDCGAVWDTTTNDQNTKAVSFTITPKELDVPQTVSTDYNGSDQSLKSLTSKPAWYDQMLYTDPTIMTITPATVKDANESGHAVAVTLLSPNYVWKNKASNPSATRTFSFQVNKKLLAINWITDVSGLTVAEFANTTEIYSYDAGTKYPNLVTKYYEDGDSATNLKDAPTGLGIWYAVAVLENASTCNYKVNATQAFNSTKKQVAYPTLSSSSASEEYDSTLQSFTYTGYDSNTMNAPAVPAGAESFDGDTLVVKNAGTYTPVYTLKDTSLYEWTGTAPGAVTITPKPVVVNSDSANATEWQRKTPTTLTFEVPTALCGTDSALNFVASYTLNGGDPVAVKASDVAVSGKTCTVNIGTGFAKGNYVLTVKLADGENYSGSVTHNFEITSVGLSLGDNDIKWTIQGANYVTADYDSGNAVFEMEYTGTPLDLSNVSVNFSSASDAPYLEQDGDLTGTFFNAVNVGEYEATFKIKAKSGGEYSCSDGPFTLKIKIVPKKLDFTNAEWEYSNDGGTSWTKITATNKPSYTGDPVTVRISPDYMAGIGLAAGDYAESYTPLSDPTEQGNKTTNVALTINNPNYTTADGSGYVMIPYNWEIAAKALTYTWNEKGQAVEVGDNAFEFPAVKFDDGNDYSQYYEYVYTVDGTDYTLDELKEYIAANWSDTTPVNGTVRVQMKDGVTEVNINSGTRPFSTGTPKTALTVKLTGSGAEYGLVDFKFSVLRNDKDERARTEVTVAGGSLTEPQKYNGNDPELITFMNGLGVGEYTITVSLKANSESSYVLTKSVFDFEVLIRKVVVPRITGEIKYNGAYINVVDYLDSNYNSAIMSLLSGYTNKAAGSYSVILKLPDSNYMWVEPETAEPLGKTLFAKAVLFADGISIDNSELTATLGWTINKIVLATDGWDMSKKDGASFGSLAAFSEMIEAKGLDVAIGYRYYDTNGNLIEEPVLKGGEKYIVEAYLTGEDAVNFEFEDGTDEIKSVSARQDYEVPQSGFAKVMGSTLNFVKTNWLWFVIGAAALLFLIILICVIAHSKKKKRKLAELAEQRRLEEKEEKEREREERRLEREERMSRMNQQQPMPQIMQMPQMMPQMQMPQQQPMMQQSSGGNGGGSISEAQFMQMQAELKAEISALKAEQSAKEIAALRAEVAMRDDISVLRSEGNRGQMQQSGMNVEAMTEIMTMALKNVLTSATQQVIAAQPAQPAQITDGSAQVPPDAVMTTVTTTKIDTTKKTAQNGQEFDRDRSRSTRSFVAPMPVDDGRVFDVGGFYKPADPSDFAETSDEDGK